MKIIEKLSTMISDELDDAEKYIDNAIECKTTDRHLADTFYELSTQEMNHMNMLHGEVVRLIDEYRQKSGDPPASMMAVYEYLHKNQTNRAAVIKTKQNMYRE